MHHFNIFNIWDLRKTSGYRFGLWFKTLFFVTICMAVGAWLVLPSFLEMQNLEKMHDVSLEKLDKFQEETRELQEKRQFFDNLKNDLARQTQILNQVRSKSWRDLLASFNKNIPEDIWIQSVDYGRQKNISIKGVGLDLNSIAKMIQNLKKDKRFRGVRLNSTNERNMDGGLVHQFMLELNFSEIQEAGK